MDVAEIIAVSRRQTGNPTTSQMSDAVLLGYLNIIYKEVYSRLTMVDSRLTWQQYVTDIVAGQPEYTLPIPSSTKTGLKRVLDVYVVDTVIGGTSGKFVKISSVDADGINIDEQYYENTTTPFYNPRDGSIFVYPIPTVSLTGGLKCTGTYIPLDLTLTSEDGDIKLPREYHNILIDGLNMWIFGEKRLLPDRSQAKVDYETGIQNMKKEEARYQDGPYTGTDPYMTDLE